MKKNLCNYEGEEKEISLSGVNEIKSNILSNDNNGNNDNELNYKKTKVKFENISIPKLSIIDTQKTFAENENKKEVIPHEVFERRKKKFHTLITVKSKILENSKKTKKRKKAKNKTVRLKENKSKKEEEDYIEEKEIKTLNESNQKEDVEAKEEFEDREIQTKLEVVLEKKFIPTQAMLCYCKCQLYLSYENMTGFEYTGLEGILCIMINRLLSNLYLQIYDILDFKKQFEIELYTNILLNRGYEIMSEKFHSIEFPNFCLGINFYSIKKAEEIKNIILNYSKALNSSLFYQYEKKNHDTFKQKKLFDFISDPKKVLNYNDKKKKNIKEFNKNNQNNEYNNLNNENENTNYLESIFGNLNKKINYKISSNEQMLSFSIDKEANEVLFDTSKGANRFLEQNNIEISDINEEYEKMKEKVKSKVKNSKFITNKTKKTLQEDIKDKENKEKIMEILNQLEGLQFKDKIKIQKEKEKFKNKIKKFNITKRTTINQKMQINASFGNLIFYGGESDSFGDGQENLEENEEEGEEEEEDEQESSPKDEENDIIKDLLKNNNINNDLNNKLNLETGNNNSEDDKNSIKLQLSGIVKKISNSSDISSNTVKKENNNIEEEKKKDIIDFISKQSSIEKKNNQTNSKIYSKIESQNNSNSNSKYEFKSNSKIKDSINSKS